jgi:Cys-rich protein (TIGR01571 family)
MSVQPSAQVITMQVVAAGPSNAPIRDWSTGTFDCFSDLSSCLCGWFCGICLACKVASRLNENSLVPLCGGGIVPLRLKTRMLLGIRGNICNDCLLASFCGPCVLCQMSRELDNVGWHQWRCLICRRLSQFAAVHIMPSMLHIEGWYAFDSRWHAVN